MKTLKIILLALFAVLTTYGQSESGKEVVIDKAQPDDIYLAGGKIELEAPVKGDVVAAGGTLIINDSIYADFTGAGGDLTVKGAITDDVRVAGGKITIDSEIGDDLVVFGGEVTITKNARINGRLVCYAGDITINGEVLGELDARGGDITLNGTFRGPSRLIAEDITIGSNAQFYKDVEYWNRDSELDFQNSLVNAKAQFNEELGEENSQLSLTTLGTKSFKSWIFYVLSALLVILVFHALFRNAFAHAVEGIEKNLGKSFGFGLIYLIGIPILILIAFLMLIGIPLGLFAASVFVFSLLFGHMIAAILIAYYLRERNEKNWGFWTLSFIALGCAVLLRLFTMIPFVGIVISIVIISITYGALTLKLYQTKKQVINQ